MVLLALPAGVSARVTGRHGSAQRHACTTSGHKVRHARHASAHGCAKHPRKHGSHKPKKGSHRTGTGASVELVPATCGEGTLPEHSGGAWACEDGSTPSCEEGTLVHATESSAPMCAVKPSGETECASGPGSCITVELTCEETQEAGAPEGCERATEQEAVEQEQEEE